MIAASGIAQTRVSALLQDLVNRDVERGLQVAAYLDGKLVVDTWAGIADLSSGRQVDGDTLFGVFSCGKGVLATAIHLLADRGKLDYDAAVAAYWPEFAAHGKESITVRQVLTHTAGIPQMPPGTVVADLMDWNAMCARVAQLTPLWEPGTQMGYHARTFGYVLGALAERVDGRRIDRFVREEIAQPLGISDLYFGIPDEVEGRVATLEPGAPGLAVAPATDSLAALAIPSAVPATAALFNRPDVRRALLPSSNGITNARSLARHYAMLAGCGILDGVRLLSPERVEIARALQVEQRDRVIGTSIARALGYGLGGPLSALSTRRAVFGHGGTGGSVGFADPDYGFAFALTKTRLVSALPGRDAAYLIAREIRSALGIPEV